MSDHNNRLFRLGLAAGEWDARQGRLDRLDNSAATPYSRGYRQGYSNSALLKIIRVDFQKPYGKQSLSFRVTGVVPSGSEFGSDVFVRGGRWKGTLGTVGNTDHWRTCDRLVVAWVRRLWLLQSHDFRALLPAVLAQHGMAQPLPTRHNPLLKTPEGAAFRDLLEETGHPFLDFYIHAWAWYCLWPLYPVPFPLPREGCVIASYYGRHWFRREGELWVAECGGMLTESRPQAQPDDDVTHIPCPTCYLHRSIPYPNVSGRVP